LVKSVASVNDEDENALCSPWRKNEPTYPATQHQDEANECEKDDEPATVHRHRSFSVTRFAELASKILVTSCQLRNGLPKALSAHCAS
jgi:hypothetical protein